MTCSSRRRWHAWRATTAPCSRAWWPSPTRRISDLRLLSDAESHQLLVEWNATAAPYPRDQTVHGLFEDRVDAAPDAVALVVKGAALTYRELDGRANHLAHHLRAAGVGEGDRVGVLMDRSTEMIVALLGILKAGGAYVPLDPQAPFERLAFMLGDTEIGVVLTLARMLGRLPASAARAIPLDAEWDAVARPARLAAREHGGRGRSRLRDLHVGLHRRAQGRRGDTPERDPAGQGNELRAFRPRRGRAPAHRALVRRLDVRDLGRAPERRPARHGAARRPPPSTNWAPSWPATA